MVNLIEEIRNLKVEDSSLFKEVKFCMIECSEEDEIKKLLFGGGARQISYMSDMVTHVIADSDESADVSEAQEIFEIPVVTCKWVLMSVRCKVLLPIEGFSPVSIQLFSGVVACPSKLSKKDRNSLWAMVTYNGGKFQITFDKSCTHLVASLPEGEKYQKAVEHNVKIVTPDWIVDSVKSKEKCDEELYHTRLLILPKSPTPSPPPAPPIEHAVITSANDRFVASGHVFHRQQNAATSIVHTVMPSSTPQSNIANQQVTWHQQVPQPQQQRMTVGTNSDFVRSSAVIWQQRPTQIVSTVPGGPNQRSMIWQQQLAAQGRLTPQHQQVILQQNRFQHQQQASIRQLGQQRAQIPNQQIPMSQQQHRSPSPQMHLIQRHQIPNSQHITISQQSSIPQQIPLVNQRIQAPTQQIQISQSHRQLSPNQQQQLQTQQLQHQQLQRASSQQMQLNVIQQSPTKASPRMHLVTQRQPLTAQHLDQVRASQQQAMNVQHRSPTRQQLSPQQQMLWQQQQRPGGRMIMQQQQQQQIGVRQVQYQVQTQGQPRLSSQQQVIWQQKQMMMTNQRQPVNRIQFSTMTPRMVTRQTIPAHPPPPYPGKVRPQTETTVIQQPNLPPESNQQQQQQSPVSIQQVVSINSAGQIVTPKTKTALANLLNNRLHHEIISPICKPDMVEANNISQTIAKADTVRRKDPSTPDKPAPKPTILLFGHEPNVRVPPELCLAGCTFCMIDYNPSDENNRLNDWKKLIINHGGKVEDNYSSQCTHVICDNAKNPIMQQAMREGKRCVTAFWLNDTLITKKMLPPSKALHLPTPCLQDKPCKRQMITTIGFEGEDSRMLKNMICTSGAKYTGYMCKFNTLIIAKKLEGLKYVKGQEWKIPIVNVQWMNDILLGIYDALRSLMAARYQNYNMEDVFKLDFTSIHPLMYSWRMPIKITDVSLSVS
ncbi:PAXIP1 (predicted) [Pycnogonum litorale]